MSNVYYVDSGHANAASTNPGTVPTAPMETIAQALALCTASNGDAIIVAPGHAETVATAYSIAVAGVTIIGMGSGDLRPTLTLSAAASTLTMNADDMTIENIIIKGGYTGGVTAAMDVKTGCDDLTVRNCVFRAGSITTELLKAVTIEATNSRITFEGCEFYEAIGGDATAAIFTEGACTDLRVIDCLFRGDWSVACLDLDAAAITTPIISGCWGHNADPDAGLFCTLNSATIATLIGLRVATQKANTVPVTDVSASFLIDCLGTDVAAANAIAYPATDVAWS